MKIFIRVIFVVVISFFCTSYKIPISSAETILVIQTPFLKIGKSVDFDNARMVGTSTFSKSDKKFSYILLNYVKFGVANLTVRFYQIFKNGRRVVESSQVNVDPEANFASDSFPLSALYKQLGKGDFLMQFLQGDNEIASAPFRLN